MPSNIGDQLQPDEGEEQDEDWEFEYSLSALRLHDTLLRNPRLSKYIKRVYFCAHSSSEFKTVDLKGVRTTLFQAAETIVRQSKEEEEVVFTRGCLWPISDLVHRFQTLRPGIKSFDFETAEAEDTLSLITGSSTVAALTVRVWSPSVAITSLSQSITSLSLPFSLPFQCPQLRRLVIHDMQSFDLRLHLFPSLAYLGLLNFSIRRPPFDNELNTTCDDLKKLEHLTVLSLDSSIPPLLARRLKPPPHLRRISIRDSRPFDTKFLLPILDPERHDGTRILELEMDSAIGTVELRRRSSPVHLNIIRAICSSFEVELILRDEEEY
jgi:hypothetical protein